jgi:phosphoglycerol transferase MdoB-like AlkP superfamily enzyme
LFSKDKNFKIKPSGKRKHDLKPMPFNTGSLMSLSLKLPKSYSFFVRLTLAFLAIQLITRSLLLIEGKLSIPAVLGVFWTGLLWDCYAWAFLGLPLLLLSALLPKRLINRFATSAVMKIIFATLVFAMAFVGFSEITFWNEFHSRFNFIAVDYLIYTNEVLANINESFPMHIIIPGIILLSAIVTFLTFRVKVSSTENPPLKKLPGLLLFGALTPLFFVMVIGPYLENHELDFRADQLSRNGWVEFYRAFRSNSIDYNSFYSTISSEAARLNVESKKSVAVPPTPYNIPKKPNVVLIVVESLGAKFLAPLGGQLNTTPFLNKLADESIFFEKLYATGTRTVRGLEAINLSIPPTPGYAVVKRPQHKNLYSLGNTFRANGYESTFLYGGRGFFDNMNSFFEGNGFRTVDQSDFSDSETTFSNAWGVCDEDLFQKAHKLMADTSSKAPKLLFMLTTSNHRPFTYPNGRIDIPSGESRAGAVKYTDYAIGKFIQDSLKKPWAANTIFVIIADHSTEGRGRFDLEMADFHIPMWIYAPNYLKPQRMKKLVSQIDLLPSLIHLLGLSDNSPFFGKSFFSQNFGEERAFIGNYQYVGLYKDKVLTTLGPNQKVRAYDYDPVLAVQKDRTSSPFIEETISFYQHASNLLTSGNYMAVPH